MEKTINFSLEELAQVVKEHIIPEINKKTIFIFIGQLGAGKTTLIKEFFRQSGITQTVTSPTFGYVNHYTSADNKQFNHFDLYRIDSIESFINNSLDEYLHKKDNISFIEWPEVINELLEEQLKKNNVCKIELDYDDNNMEMRILKIS